ncbi:MULTISPECIES: LETM1-related biofilm-associated protein [Maribacter]|uniref:LETM1-related biofilm-associated protein n=1 Tax=Maribacter flavus TaxID=1658664 RepID=A0ABU7IJF9_9FLAO|nr:MULTISPECIES: LETM1-related biofilm-associated protein [Maribacter]MDC6406116.1 LETM1-related biofilm-associated protein [Maribacter sp. PR66]MEE1973099.1 LETM1-related biofilm-associated protein [Maribacter flavus]
MNPSANGWIDKFGSLVKYHDGRYTCFDILFEDLNSWGFVYGINTGFPDFITPEHEFSEDEKAKINLLTALYFTLKIAQPQTDFQDFLEKIFRFYETLEVNKVSFLGKLFSGNKTSSKLEKILDSRVYLEDNIISKTFNSSITNSLLFIDVLLFKRYLMHAKGIKKHAQRLEYLAINITYHALTSKRKNKKDKKLAQLLASSLTFIDGDSQKFDNSYRNQLLTNDDLWEKRYLLKLACLTVWEDGSLEFMESEFIKILGKDLQLDAHTIKNSLAHVSNFINSNKETIPFLQDQNMAIKFYDSMSRLVNRLILRNKKRLLRELSGSAELVSLLSKSTVRDLTKEEKKKVQTQLLDIFKSIPSLAIFLLPGGAILLPIFIKLIPTLLPSAFDENRVENEE